MTDLFSHTVLSFLLSSSPFTGYHSAHHMGSMGTAGNHALIFGATGIQGWAVTKELLNGYPTADSFDRVTALANRPPSENLLWPESKKLQVISGINLLHEGGQEALEEQMKENVPGIDNVTHVFFFGKTYAGIYMPLRTAERDPSLHLQGRPS